MSENDNARDMDKTNKAVQNGEVKAHMSTSSGDQEGMEKRAADNRKDEKSKNSGAAGASQKDSASRDQKQANPPKKKKIIAVYNTHNSQTGFRGSKNDRQRRDGQKKPAGSSQSKPAQNGEKSGRQGTKRPAGTGLKRPVPSVGPDGQRLSRPSDRSARLNGTAQKSAEEQVKQVQEENISVRENVQDQQTPQINTAASHEAATVKTEAPKPDTAKSAAPVNEAPVSDYVKPDTGKSEAAVTESAERSSVSTSDARPQNPRRDGEQRRENTVRREGTERREGASRTVTYQNRDGQARRDGGQRREGTERREGTSRTGTYQNRDGQNRREGTSRTGTYQNRDGQNRRDGGTRSGGYQNQGQSRDGKQGGFQNKDGRQNQGRDTRRSAQGGAAAAVPASENRKSENRRAENKNRNDDARKDRNSKFNDGWGGKPGTGGRKNTQGQKNGQKNDRKGKAPVPAQKPSVKKEDNTPKVIEIPEMISIQDLAEKMKIQPSVIIKKLFLAGQLVTINSELDFEQAGEIAMENNFDPVPEEKEDVIGKMLADVEDPEETLIERPPVVCVMGHVDHGKTSLLDAIRDTHVIDREAGGITQHIGAYVVTIDGRNITFLDTPGHEAFTAMRMRGANSTDIAILVVAADDGVMPQTVEAINHAKAAGIEVIVAINKIDKPSANVERVKQELVEYNLIPEDWGGSTVFVPVSAHTHEGIDNLLEMILLTADVLELKANPNRRARGLVIEAQLDKGKGPVATVLVQKGTLHVGDHVAVGSCYGKVRAMMDENGHRVKEAGPSRPVEILGLNDVPAAGEIFVSPETEKEARNIADTYVKESREKLLKDTKLKMSLEDLNSQIQSGTLKELNIIIKADVQGSVEAVKQSLLKLSNDEVVVKIIHGGVGAINESDITLASASNAIVIGFNVRPDVTAKETAEQEKVEIRLYRVIYDAINDVEAAMKGMLEPIYEEKVIGHAEVRQIFKASGVGNIAGSYVLDGTVQRGCKCRITREGTQIFDGSLASLKRFKDDVKEVRAGYECGLVFEKFNDIQELDIIEAYIMAEVPR